MSTFHDETAADVPVRDVTVNLSRPAPEWSAVDKQDISRVSREELEDRFLRLYEETLLLKQHVHKQEDKIRKLGTKLMRLVKDRGRMEQLAAGGGPPASRLRDVEMEEMMEELQEKLRSVEAEKEVLKQRLLVAKQQLITSHSRRSSPYRQVQSRVNSGLKRLRDNVPSPRQALPTSTRSSEGVSHPPPGLLPRFGHSLLEEARAELRHLENVVEHQRIQMEEMEVASEQLREELRRKEAEFEERLLQFREQQTSKLRTHVSGNMVMIKLQKQLMERTNRVTELEGRFLQLQESQRNLKLVHSSAMLKVEELSAQLKTERLRSSELETRLQSSSISRMKMEELQERMNEAEQERDLLKDNNEQLLNRAMAVSLQQKGQTQEQQLKLQVAQLEATLKADLIDKNEILHKFEAERDANQKLIEDNKKLHLQFLEQKQQLEEVNQRLGIYSREKEYDEAELTEALLLIKKRRSQRSGHLSFLKEDEKAEEGGGGGGGGVGLGAEGDVRELRAIHAETIQELEKTRNLLSMEGKISKGYKAELEAVLKKMEADRVTWEQKLEQQVSLLDSRTAKIQRLEAQLQVLSYGTTPSVFKQDVPDEDGFEEEPLHLEGGENLVELKVVSASISPSALRLLGDAELSTFCTYSFYSFELHSTPVARGRAPRYGFTSRYPVTVDQELLDYLLRGSVVVELQQALGLDWRMLAGGRIRLQALLEQEGGVRGSVPLVGVSDEARSFGSVDYWMKLKVPLTETLRLHREKLKEKDDLSNTLNQDAQSPPVPPLQLPPGWNQLLLTIHGCRDLRTSGASVSLPSPFVVYKFYDFGDHPTATAFHCASPQFQDLRSYPVAMDTELDRYLRSEALLLYVFDQEEERMDAYLGRARVPLLPLSRDQGISGLFQLTDPSGLNAGLIQVTLEWTSTYQEREEEREEEVGSGHPEALGSKAARPKLVRDKKVSFRDASAPEDQEEDMRDTAPAAMKPVFAPPPNTTEEEEEEEEEESHFSEGQLVVAGSPSDASEVSEDMVEDVDESSRSDSDDIIVHGRAAERKPLQRVRLEVVSLTLRPESRVSLDGSVVRLFVEYSLLDLPTEETPLSLPKPPHGKSINFNYSKVIPVDSENNGARRRLLRRVLQGGHPHMERIRFTVVSEPPEEEEQERECEDVGAAFIRIPDILERQQDMVDTSLEVVDVEDSSQVVGSLTVTVEGLEALQAIMEDQDLDLDQEPTPVSSLLPSS
ncbi:protein fantom isoform X2 [Pungitius pungitius]|uniref:protein fantom isoform X2 n=1 Tax=Pungitius pungitius TaxID=134920 RepID=UPI002E13C92E